MTYRQRFSIFILIDTCIVLSAVFLSWILISPDFSIIPSVLMLSSLAILFSYQAFAVIFKLYKKVWEYASIGELLIILKIASYTILVAIIAQHVLHQQILYRFLTVTWLLLVLFIGG